ELEDRSTWSGVGLSFLLTVLGIFTTRAIHRFREHLRDGEALGSNVPPHDPDGKTAGTPRRPA
ncbi:MAG: hypothetical protein ABI076_11525, partial [Acidobacteriaceae bacterium]